jgi:hypothetical protein
MHPSPRKRLRKPLVLEHLESRTLPQGPPAGLAAALNDNASPVRPPSRLRAMSRFRWLTGPRPAAPVLGVPFDRSPAILLPEEVLQ